MHVRAADAPDAPAELLALHETTLALLDGLDLDALLETIVERAGVHAGTGHGYIELLEPDGSELRLRVGTGACRDLVGHRVPIGEGLAGRVIATGEPLVVDDYSTWAGALHELKELPLRAVVGVPLSGGGRIIGIIGLAHLEPGRSFEPSEVDLLSRFGQLASLALENARLYASSREELSNRRDAEDELLDTIARLGRSEQALRQAHVETIRRLAYVAEFRDSETGEHVERMSRLCALLGRRLGLADEQCELLRAASPLHDIGKIAISDEILLKPGPLSADERKTMERHAELGHRLLAGSESELLELAATIALTHHEWFDGTGYPQGLAGDAIPLAGRIASVADVFDALTSDRSYRSALTVDDAIELMRQERGTHFDPLVLDTFLDAIPEVLYAGSGDQQSPGAHEGEALPAPARLRPREREDHLGHPGPLETLDPAQLRSACAAAENELREGGVGRRAIEECFGALVTGLEGRVLVSTYVMEHDRLWLIAQRGYREVLDGFTLEHGVLGRAVRTGQTQFVPDVTQDSDFVEATSGILAEVTVPFDTTSGVRPMGALNIETVGAALPPEAETLFAPLAQLLGERLGEMREGLEVDVATLARLCVHASSVRGTNAIAEFAARTVGRLLGLDCVQLDLRPAGGVFNLASFWRREASGLRPVRSADVQRLALIEETGVAAAYHLFDLRHAGFAEADLSAPWIVWFPLKVAGGEIGAIIGRLSARPEFEHERVEAATLFAQHAAALLDVSLALRREQRAAITDALTGLLNRRGFDERLYEELERATHGGTTVALVLADCDDLKAMNDRGGHELGDRVLQSFAQCLRTSKRAEDAAARIGGDEFAVIVPGAGVEAAARITDCLRRELLDLPIAKEVPVAATFGVATFPADGTNVADLLRAADRALYLAKRAGGDGTVTWPADAA